MNATPLYLAAALLFAIGVIHSGLGERYILIRLFRRGELPRLFGSDWFTRRTLRFAWHITTLAWWGLAGILVAAAGDDPAVALRLAVRAVAATSLVTALVAGVASRGRHLAWIVFAAVAVLAWLAAR